jgi:V8-like Glu-specific endopeptidase
MSPRTAPPTRARISASAAACVVAALLVVAPTAEAAGHAAGAGSSSFSVAPDRAAAAVAFWTPERRAAAIPTTGSGAVAAAAPRATGAADDRAAAETGHAQRVPRVSHIGRMYFTIGDDTRWCTANVVESPNRSTIATAAHCVTQGGKYASSMVFYPDEQGGDAPFGAWAVVDGRVTAGYTARGDDDALDSAFLVVARDQDGVDITSRVGASPVLFDVPARRAVTAYGYPGAGRFDGTSLQRCTATGSQVSPPQIAFRCDMTGGASGGPILAGDSSAAPQFANIANVYGDESHNLGPLWQAGQHEAYDEASVIAN